jgi:membrane fusion protein, multidrug efflux system
MPSGTRGGAGAVATREPALFHPVDVTEAREIGSPMLRSRKMIVGGAVTIIVVVAAVLAVRHQQLEQAQSAKTAAAQNGAIPVMAAPATAADVPLILRGLGTVTAFNTVAVKSRVEGNITRINFSEGQEVKAGDVLFELDARPYQAALEQANATLARDQATLANAQTDLARYAQLLKSESAPEQQYATQKATVAAAEATVKSDRAAIDAAELNVEYATIRSPVDGIVGIRQIDLGNLVQANSQTLVVVTQIKPIYVLFSLPEADIPRIRDAMTERKLTVQAYDAADQKQLSQGVLNLVDNQVDQTTGTVKLKAQFANSDEALWPGQFVNAHLVLDVVKNGVTIPAAAAQIGPDGRYVYAVRSDQTVEVRPITVTQTENNVSLIGSGLRPGEQVITSGWFKLTPGAKVAVTEPVDGSASVTAAAAAPPGTGAK